MSMTMSPWSLMRRDHHRAAGQGEFDGVADDVHHHLPQAPAIGDQRQGRAAEIRHQPHAALFRHRRHQLHRAVDQLLELDGLQAQLQLAGFDLGEIEDVVDEGEEMRARLVDVLGVVLIARRRSGPNRSSAMISEKPRMAFKRRAQFMAHARQEIAFGAAGGDRDLALVLQFAVEEGGRRRLGAQLLGRLRQLHLARLLRRDVDDRGDDGVVAVEFGDMAGEQAPEAAPAIGHELDFVVGDLAIGAAAGGRARRGLRHRRRSLGRLVP